MKNVGDGTRILNFIVDGLLILILSIGLYRFWNFYVVYWHFKYFNFWWFFAVVLLIYYNFFEIIWARTPGKWVTSSKVVTQNGDNPSVLQIIARSFLRLILIDFFFNAFWGKPLHDKLSKTEVVEN